ncbi:MAG: hypothetical protein GY856_33580 [bacterium]|nr:hypothetical protein [bacterium]
MRRDAVTVLLLVVFLVFFGGFAWLTRHPDAEILRRAEDWPVVGPWASQFREAYRPRKHPICPPPGEPRERRIPEPREIEAHPPPSTAYETIWVLPGMRLREEPSETSPTILQFAKIANVPKLEQRGDWYRVWRKGKGGWVHLEDYDPKRDPPFGSEPDPPGPLLPREPDEETLTAARKLLGDGDRVLRLGPYALYTDSRDDQFLSDLDRVAARLDEVYAERYQRRPLGTPRAAVVLYQAEDAYRRFQARSDRIRGLPAAGHKTSGLAVLFIGRSSRQAVRSTFIHELVHLINRRALGPALPSWLDEGLADDLAHSKIDESGRIRPDLLAGERREEPGWVTFDGGLASLSNVNASRRDGTLMPVQDLMSLEWEEFVRPDRSRRHYAASALWVRFLLEAEGGRYAVGFRDFLDSVANGHPPTGERLRQKLERDWSLLNGSYRGWIAFKAKQAGIPDADSGTAVTEIVPPRQDRP